MAKRHAEVDMAEFLVSNDKLTVFVCLHCMASKADWTKFVSNFGYTCNGKVQKVVDLMKKSSS